MGSKFNENDRSQTSASDDWLTPPEIVEALGAFDLDPCYGGPRPFVTAKTMWGAAGLSTPWPEAARVWLNPPYRQVAAWLKKLTAHRNGVALTFARTETKWFHRSIWREASAVFFFEGRLRFYYPDGTLAPNVAGAPSCLATFDPSRDQQNKHALERAVDQGLLKGHIVVPQTQRRLF